MLEYLEEVFVLKARIKFTKTGSLKFVGHLDIMRYFQKAFRRAKVDIAYSKGFSPHQQTSFAAPLGIGLTSEGEYMDAEFHSTDSSQVMIDRINAVMADGISIVEFLQLDDNEQNAMSSVAGADYRVTLRDGYYDVSSFFTGIEDFLSRTEILIMKKTKKSEREVDIRPMIYKMSLEGESIFLQLQTGSVANLKPDTVMEAFCQYKGLSYQQFAFAVHRIETYLQIQSDDSSTLLRPLGAVGRPIE